MDQLEAARQAWPILVNAAKQKKTLTYKELSQEIGLHWRALRHPLDLIHDYCMQRWPISLTAIVVLKGVKQPGKGFSPPKGMSFDELVRRVHAHPWPIRNPFQPESQKNKPYWVLVNNPKMWAIDHFLKKRIVSDKWGIRRTDQEKFAPGQLAIIRVGVDKRNTEQRNGLPRLKSGIYAVCQIESLAYNGRGALSKYWAKEERQRRHDRPTVDIRYLHTFLHQPLTIERLRRERPNLSPHILNGLETSSFPISEKDFRIIVEMLGLDFYEIGSLTYESSKKGDIQDKYFKKYENAAPSVIEKISRQIERGAIGAQVKRAAKFKCQICREMGLDPKGFVKKDGIPYVEAHHVVPVARLVPGSLDRSNIIAVCANHHRELHYGRVKVRDRGDSFEFVIRNKKIQVLKH